MLLYLAHTILAVEKFKFKCCFDLNTVSVTAQLIAMDNQDTNVLEMTNKYMAVYQDHCAAHGPPNLVDNQHIYSTLSEKDFPMSRANIVA